MTKQEKSNSSSLFLSEQAMTYLGLSQQPFAAEILTADTVFSDATLEQLIDTSQHHLQFSNLLLIIEGDIGSGKTTLFRQLLINKFENLFVVPVQASATDTLTQIQQTISSQLKDQGDARYLDENLKRLQKFEQTPVLIIDDAHVLTDMTLQELLRYQQQLKAELEVNLKILMLANTGMAKTIETISNIEHKQLYVQEMPAYTIRQIHAFLLQRLSAVNYQGEDHFDEVRLEQILKKSGGAPLKIMQQAIAQLEAIAKKQTPSSFSFTRPVILFSALTIITLIIITSYFSSLPTPAPENSSVKTEPVVNAPAILDEKNIHDDTNDIFDKPQPSAIDAEKPLKKIDAEITRIEDESETDTLITDTKTDETMNSVPDEIIYSTITEPPLAPEPPIPPVPAEIIITPQADTIKTENIIKKAPPVSPAIKAESIDANIFKLHSLGIHNPEWLKQQDAHNWTLQIMGAQDPATLVKFSTQHKLGDTSAWFKTEMGGKPWYVLVHRLYTDKDIARQSIQRLPEGLKNTKPWVKNIGVIHKSMKP